MDEWKRIGWSDESRFLIHHVDGRVRERRLPDEQVLPSSTAGHTQAGGSGTMHWGTFSWEAACGRTDHEICELSEHHCGSVAPLHWRLSSQLEMELPAGQRPMSQG
ncbi:hypothetical protein AVEN_127470-1 [Araneus ventricosus]|uniref:Uncharacterized protein n=1 Tax=Araneus ventricosus TaxID=182803 RepID=A0A4Y2NBY1_ARAVE|nr:hypothetical protein AVEN_127470-1 [Araneus ventricosus]